METRPDLPEGAVVSDNIVQPTQLITGSVVSGVGWMSATTDIFVLRRSNAKPRDFMKINHFYCRLCKERVSGSSVYNHIRTTKHFALFCDNPINKRLLENKELVKLAANEIDRMSIYILSNMGFIFIYHKI